MDVGGLLMELEPVDFYINQRPVSISFECPHCLMDVEIDWGDVDVPEYWGDAWGHVECPYCEKEIKLGDYDI